MTYSHEVSPEESFRGLEACRRLCSTALIAEKNSAIAKEGILEPAWQSLTQINKKTFDKF
jgi:hypothetical protein